MCSRHVKDSTDSVEKVSFFFRVILVDVTHWRLFVDGLDDELLVVEGDVSDLAPGESDLWGQSGEDTT